MSRTAKLSESAWAGCVGSAGDRLPGPIRPLEASASGEPAEGWQADAAALLAGAPLARVSLVAWWRGAGSVAEFAADAGLFACALRGLVPDSGGGQARVAPGIELADGSSSELLEVILRLVPDLDGDVLDPPVWTVPVARAGEVFAALRTPDDGADRGDLPDELGWDAMPVELKSLETIDGDLTLTVTAPGRRTRVIRLLHGTDGWVSLAATGTELRYQQATKAWVRAELLWELAAAFETGLQTRGAPS